MAKKSTTNQRKGHNVEWLQRCRSQYMFIFIRLAVVASQLNPRNPAKFFENSKL